MSPMDEQTVQQIWSRVQGKAGAAKGGGGQGEAKPGCDQMTMQMAELVGHYQSIFAGIPREKRQPLQQMIRQGRHQIGVLNGLCRLHTGKKPAIPPQRAAKIPRTEHYRYCLGLQQQLIRACGQYSDDQRFGYIFREMGRILADHTRMILHLLGES